MRLSRADLRLLQVFDAIVRHGGFAAAESELNVNVSTISSHMAALEERLGFRLCQRGRVGFSLTEKGEAVHKAAGQVFKALADFESEIDALRGRLSGELRIGLVDSLATDPLCRLPQAVAAFRRHAGQVTLALHQDRPQDLQRKVLDGSYHCGLGGFPHRLSGLNHRPLCEEQHFLYVGRGHPLFDEPDERLSLDRLRAFATVHRGYWPETSHWGGLSIGPTAATVHQIEPQLMLILSGAFTGLLPDHYAAPWVRRGRLRALLPAQVSYRCTITLITRKGQRMTEALRRFIEDCAAAHRAMPGNGKAAGCETAGRSLL